METCCSLGLITLRQAQALKKVGISRYHANIETAPSFFSSICTTHTFADKAVMIRTAQQPVYAFVPAVYSAWEKRRGNVLKWPLR